MTTTLTASNGYVHTYNNNSTLNNELLYLVSTSITYITKPKDLIFCKVNNSLLLLLDYGHQGNRSILTIIKLVIMLATLLIC